MIRRPGWNPLPRLATADDVDPIDPVWPLEPNTIVCRVTSAPVDLEQLLADLDREASRLLGGASLD